jgi:hypothetical protein
MTVAAVGAIYVLRRLGRRSGATCTEAVDTLPGDEIVEDALWQSTRAIDAPPEEVWPWIVQVGFPSHRAGWYTPHWLDRFTFGIKQRSAGRIVPELQQLGVGDLVPDSDNWSVFFTMERVERPHALVLHSTRHRSSRSARSTSAGRSSSASSRPGRAASSSGHAPLTHRAGRCRLSSW